MYKSSIIIDMISWEMLTNDIYTNISRKWDSWNFRDFKIQTDNLIRARRPDQILLKTIEWKWKKAKIFLKNTWTLPGRRKRSGRWRCLISIVVANLGMVPKSLEKRPQGIEVKESRVQHC